MTLGEKIRAARLEAGLSQRQLCGETITRNMLSQIENGAANPSMATLQCLAGRLGKPVGWFLEEQSLQSPNADVMTRAREAYGLRQLDRVWEILSEYQGPDPLFQEEYAYLMALVALARAEALIGRGANGEAARLLEEMHRGSIYYRQEMEQTRRKLLARVYPLLEEQYRLQGDFERAYYFACKQRGLHG